MKFLKTTRHLVPFHIPLVAYWIFMAILVIQFGYIDSFRFFNEWHNPVTDTLALIFTHMGDGLIISFLVYLACRKEDLPLAISGLLAIIITGIIVQLLKHLVFDGWDRPDVIFELYPEIHIVMADPARHNAFPSGHSTSVTTGFLIIAYIFRDRNRWFQLILGIFAAYFCYTRIHVGVHFPGDTLVGSMLASIFTIFWIPWTHDRVIKWMGTHKPTTVHRADLIFLYCTGAATLFHIGRLIYLSYFPPA